MVDQARVFFEMNLFGPDLFSDPLPRFHSLERSAQSQLTQLFVKNYSHLGTLTKIECCNEIGINSRNFRVQTSESSYILKRVDKPFEEAKKTVDFSVWLHQNGAPVPAIYPNSKSQLLTIEGDYIFYIMEEVIGTFFSGEQDELPAVRKLFESLLVTESLPVSAEINLPTLPVLCDDDYAVLKEFENKLDQVDELLGIKEATCIVLRWKEIKQLVIDHLLDLKNNPLRSGLMHIDLHPHNIMLSQAAKQAIVLDLDSFQICAPDVALGFGIFKILRQMGVRSCSLGQLRDTKVELLAFNHTKSATRYLLLARVEVLRRLILILRLSLKGDKSWNHILPVQLRALSEIEILI